METSKSSVWSALASAIVPTIIIFIANTLIGLAGQPKGEVVVSDEYAVGGVRLLLIRVDNYKDKPLNEIIIDSDLRLDAGVSSNEPYSISIMQGASASPKGHLWRLDVMHGRSVTNLAVPIPDGVEHPLVKIVNASSLGLLERKEGESGYSLDYLVKNGVINALVYFIVIVLANLLLTRHLDSKIEIMKERANNAKMSADDLKDELLRSREQQDRLKADVDVLGVKSTKIRLLLHARISDYSKELDFWRYAIKNMLLDGGAKERDYESLVRHVVSSLRTYSTTSRMDFSFDELKVLSRIMSESESGKGADDAKPND